MHPIIRHPDSERDTLVKDLPISCTFRRLEPKEMNAHVEIDTVGGEQRLSIFLKGGGSLHVALQVVDGDLAPFSD